MKSTTTAMATLVGTLACLIAQESPSPEAPPQVIKDRSKPHISDAPNEKKSALTLTPLRKRDPRAALNSQKQGPEPTPTKEMLEAAGAVDTRNEKVFGKSIYAIDVPSGFDQRAVRVADGKGNVQRIEIEPQQPATGKAKTIKGLPSAPSRIVPIGKLPPEATHGSGLSISNSAKLDQARNEISIPLPESRGQRYQIHYSSDGQQWKNLGIFPAGKWKDKRRHANGFYKVTAIGRKTPPAPAPSAR